MSSVQGGKIVWCLLSTVAKLSGVFCPQWLKGVVSFVHLGKKCPVSFGSGVFCLAPNFKTPVGVCSKLSISIAFTCRFLERIKLIMFSQFETNAIMNN